MDKGSRRAGPAGGGAAAGCRCARASRCSSPTTPASRCPPSRLAPLPLKWAADGATRLSVTCCCSAWASGAGGASAPTICVEIKTKCGFLPSAATNAPGNAVKRCTSRFAMHQHLKLAQGKLDHLSKYDPLDLFSGSAPRVAAALDALLDTPQNNLHVFRDGAEIFGSHSEATAAEQSGSAAQAALEAGLEGFVTLPAGQRLAALVGMLMEQFVSTDVLARLLAAQRLDVADIEGAIHAYDKLFGCPDGIGGDAILKQCSTQDDEHMRWRAAVTAIQALPMEECRKLVRDFLIAATAKDCGLMVAFCGLPDSIDTVQVGERGTVVTCNETGQRFLCKMSFVDLDMKPLAKFPSYYKLDAQIVEHYKNAQHQHS
eukprot:SM000004S15009  [mRNA]  locus=s4:705433:708161:- [translate_table: standard]